MKEVIIPVKELSMDKPELNYWKGEVKASLKRQNDEFIQRIGYETLVKYFEADQIPYGQQWCLLDEFSPAIISVISSVYYQNPTVQVEAGTPDADKPIQPRLEYLLTNPEFRPFSQTDLLRGALQYGMKKGGMKEEMQISAFDLMVAGFCAVEINHTSTADEVSVEDGDPYANAERSNPIIDKVGGAIKGLVDKVMGGDKSQANEEEVAENVAKTTQKDLYTDTSDQTYVKRWNPMDILFDSRAKVFKESRYIVKVVRMTVAEFNAKYPGLKHKNLADSELPNLQYTQHLKETNKKCVTLYEVEIKKKGPRNCVLVLNMALDEPVDYYERAIITNDFSIKYGCMDKYGKIYPMSRAKKAKRPQDDINHYMTIQFEHVDRAQRKIAVYTNGLTESGKTAQRSSDVYAIVEKNTPQQVYEVMPAPQVVIENKEIVAAMRESINKSVGTNELAKSGDSDNDTLGQDQLQTQSFQTNVNAVQDALQDVADELLDGMKDIILQVWDGKDYFKVTGINGGDAWYDPSMGPLADILIGDYNVNCNMASAARPNPMKDRQELMELNAMVTSPQMVQFAMLHGQRPSMETLNNLIKTFQMNPEMVFEPIEPLPVDPLQPPSPTPPTPNAQLVQSEGGRMAKGAAQIPLGGQNVSPL